MFKDVTALNAIPRHRAYGFTLLELLVIIAIICLLAAFIVPTRSPHEGAPGVLCMSQLKQIDRGFLVYAEDNTNLFPMQSSVANNGTVKLTVAEQLAPTFEKIYPYYATPQTNYLYRLLVCPADKGRRAAENPQGFGNTNISYFLNADAQCTNQPSHVVLAGDRDLKFNGSIAAPGLLTITTNSEVDWAGNLHPKFGNVAFADGHVERRQLHRLNELFMNQPLATNRLAIP